MAGAGVITVAWLDRGLEAPDPTTAEFVAVVLTAVPAGFLLVFSLFSLLSYFVFMPSLTDDAHLFARVHAAQLLHPLTSSVVLGLLAFCIYFGRAPTWAAWGGMFTVYVIQTTLMVARIRQDQPSEERSTPANNLFFMLLSLVLGGELVTIAGGARPLAPWRLKTLPDDTWIVDVRTKPEFYWNRLHGAENYPWGVGLTEAARDKSLDRPVLVTCLSGHRSPAIAVALRRLGFKTVYNLTWGILYLLLLERGKKSEGPFSLTRPHIARDRRGEDLRYISHGYITCAAVTLIGAPIEHAYLNVQVPLWQAIIGGVISLVGVALMVISYRALGRNFRIYAAPRRSGTLVETGIYSWIRHPMYLGTIMAVGGYVVLFGSLIFIPTWLGVLILYIIKASKEEPILLAKFPQYEEYKRHTWRFIPYIY